MGIPITWNGQPTHQTHQPAKLHKAPPSSSKHVNLTIPSIEVHSTDMPLSHPSAAPFGESSIPTAEGKKKKSMMSRLFTTNPDIPALIPPSPMDNDQAVSPTLEIDTFREDEWTHHTSYFPDYEPIKSAAKSNDHLSHDQNAYFPDYSPIASTSHPIHTYTEASGALMSALSGQYANTTEDHHHVGHPVVIHYPDLPRFAEYQSAGIGKEWTAGQWGVEGWTGYGWAGEKLPTNDGLIFGAPMPKGVSIKDDGKGKKAGAGEEGGGEVAKETAPKAEGGAAGAEAGGEGDGAKQKKKKKK